MASNQFITPEGTKDYLFEEAAARRLVTDQLESIYQSCGFAEVQTSGLEFLDVFQVKGHGIPIPYMYKLVDAKGRLMVVRPDTTMPIARLCATRLKAQALPLRFYYSQPVYSATPSMRGRSDEVLQTGIELIGAKGMKADLEVIATAAESLGQFDTADFRLEIGHIGIFNALVDELHLQEDQREQVRMLIETKNYPALNDLLDQFGDSTPVKALKQLPRLFGDSRVFEKAAHMIHNQQAIDHLHYLQELYNSLSQLGSITVDLGLVNRTDYYTGVVFRGYLEGAGEAVLSGGRYDNLVSQFGREAGAIGFAINVDSVAKWMLTRHPVTIPKTDILIHAAAGYEMQALLYREVLRKAGFRCENSTFSSLEEAIAYVKTKEIPQLHLVEDSIQKFQMAGGKAHE